MAMIQCPECGKEISNKAYACPYCGNPMAVRFEKPESKNHGRDDEELKNNLELARRARAEENSKNAAHYYELVLKKAPMSWEAAFYQIYYTAMQCTIAEIPSAAKSVANCLNNVMSLIVKQEDDYDSEDARYEVADRCNTIAISLANGAVGYISQCSSSNWDFAVEHEHRIKSITQIYKSLISAVENSYPDDHVLINKCAKAYIAFIFDKYRYPFQSHTFYAISYNEAVSEVEAYSELIKKTEPDYSASELPKPQKQGGCYIATSVYGSYDCPQVWTLRRYRDYTLAVTWYGRAFIRIYYAISPTFVKWFGQTKWFRKVWKAKLDSMVYHLNADGIKDTPYEDRNW